MGQALHDPRHRKQSAPRAVPRPMRQRVAGGGGIAHDPHVRPAIAQSQQGIGVGDHFAHHVQVPGGIIGHGQIQDRLAIPLHQQVIGHLIRGAAFACRAGGDAGFGRRFVVRRVAQGEHAVPALDPLGSFAALERLRQKAGAERRIAQRGQPLREGQVSDAPVAGTAGERVLGQFPPQQHAGGAGADLAGDPQAVAVRRGDPVQQPAPAVWPRVGLQQGDRHRAPRRRGQALKQAELIVLLLEVRHDLKPAPAGVAQGVGDRGQFRFLGAQCRRRAAVQRAVIERAGGRKAERARLHSLHGQFRHPAAVLLCCRLTVCAALAHDEHPQGGVGNLRRHVHIVVVGGEGVHEIREALPRPGQALRKHHFRDVLHTFHQLHQHIPLVRMTRCKPDTAVAQEHGGDAVPGGGRQAGSPCHLCVVVRVHIDEARRDQLALCVDLLRARRDRAADGGDPAVGDGDVGFERVIAGAVDDGAVANHQGRRSGHGVGFSGV